MAHRLALDPLYKLFVGNLPWTIGHVELSKYFSRFGALRSALVTFDQTGVSRGFGYIEFSYRDGYMKALEKKDHFLEGRVLALEPMKSQMLTNKK